MPDAEYALAEAIGGKNHYTPQQQREQTAALEGHDAIIPTATHSSASTQPFTTPTQESHPTFPSRPTSIAFPRSHNAATSIAETQSLASTTGAFSEAPEQPFSSTTPATAPVAVASNEPAQGQQTPIPATNYSSPTGLASSTISQWVPGSGSPESSQGQVTTGSTVPATLGRTGSRSFDKTVTTGLDESCTWIAPGKVSSSAASQASTAISSTNLEVVASTAGATTLTKHEERSTSTPSTDPDKALESAPDAATYSSTEAVHSIDQQKSSTSTGPMLNGKASSASFNLEKGIDLEAAHGGDDSDKKDAETTKLEGDPNMVDWDGPDDPNNALNWSGKLKSANILLLASITFLTQVMLQVG